MIGEHKSYYLKLFGYSSSIINRANWTPRNGYKCVSKSEEHTSCKYNIAINNSILVQI